MSKKEKVVKVNTSSKHKSSSSSYLSSSSSSSSPRKTQQLLSSSVSGYYFMGRLNPPHDGHINAIVQAIQSARLTNAIPLILLGNGPALKEHKSTPAGRTTQIIDESFDILDNPISFDLKKQIIEYKLHNADIDPPIDPSNYLIVEKDDPGQQVFDYVTCIKSKPESHGRSVEIYNVAGDKENDTKKLDFISKSALAAVKQFIPDYDEPILSMAINAGENPMSATKVRLSIYKQLLPDIYPPTEDSEQKLAKYADFYGEFENNYPVTTLNQPGQK